MESNTDINVQIEKSLSKITDIQSQELNRYSLSDLSKDYKLFSNFLVLGMLRPKLDAVVELFVKSNADSNADNQIKLIMLDFDFIESCALSNLTHSPLSRMLFAVPNEIWKKWDVARFIGTQTFASPLDADKSGTKTYSDIVLQQVPIYDMSAIRINPGLSEIPTIDIFISAIESNVGTFHFKPIPGGRLELVADPPEQRIVEVANKYFSKDLSKVDLNDAKFKA